MKIKNTTVTVGLILLAAVFAISCNKTRRQETEDLTATEQVKESTPQTPQEAESGWVTTASGLKYFDHAIGDGEAAVSGMRVEMHYTGWLWEDGQRGRKFDSSHDRGQPFSFQLGVGQVIRGWDEGILGMKVGGKRELVIPPELGYGPRGFGNVIPPNSTLDFEVEFLSVLK